MTHIVVIDQVTTDITQHSDPKDSWSRDSTSESHCIEGIKIGKDYGDIECSFDVKPNVEYFLLYYIYGSGDSFGSDDGLIHFVCLYDDEKLALKSAKMLNVAAKQNKSQAPCLNDEGTMYEEYLSGVNDYFGCYNGATVIGVMLQ